MIDCDTEPNGDTGLKGLWVVGCHLSNNMFSVLSISKIHVLLGENIAQRTALHMLIQV